MRATNDRRATQLLERVKNRRATILQDFAVQTRCLQTCAPVGSRLCAAARKWVEPIKLL